MTALPPAVASALRERILRAETPTPDRVQSSRVAPGDIRVIQGLAHIAAESRIGLVRAVDHDNEFADVLLLHTAPELACSTDLIVPKAAASAQYDVIVQTDLRAVVWTWQLGRAVGRLDRRALDAVKVVAAAEGGGPESYRGYAVLPGALDLRTGIRLAGPSDRRWSFKAAEGEALRRLAEDCTAALLDRGLVWEIDPGLLQPGLLDRAAVPLEVIEELVHWAKTRTLTISDADLVALDDMGALTVQAWESLRDIGADVWTSLQDVVLDATTGVTRVPSGSTRRLVTASHLRPLDDSTFQHVHVIGREEAVRT